VAPVPSTGSPASDEPVLAARYHTFRQHAQLRLTRYLPAWRGWGRGETFVALLDGIMSGEREWEWEWTVEERRIGWSKGGGGRGEEAEVR
jgi:hypothetical protein